MDGLKWPIFSCCRHQGSRINEEPLSLSQFITTWKPHWHSSIFHYELLIWMTMTIVHGRIWSDTFPLIIIKFGSEFSRTWWIFVNTNKSWNMKQVCLNSYFFRSNIFHRKQKGIPPELVSLFHNVKRDRKFRNNIAFIVSNLNQMSLMLENWKKKSTNYLWFIDRPFYGLFLVLGYKFGDLLLNILIQNSNYSFCLCADQAL